MQVEKRAGYGTGVPVDFRDQESLPNSEGNAT